MQTSVDKRHILLITRNLPPLVGGMERLLQNVTIGIAEYAQVTVIGPRGCSGHLPAAVTVREVPANLLSFLLVSTWIALRTCMQQSFEVIIGGSGLTAPTLYLLSLFHRSKTVLFLHGLDLVVDSYLYRWFFLPCIRKVSLVITNSLNTKRLALERGVEASSIVIINPGTELPEFPRDDALARIRRKYNINFGKVILFVGRLTRRKGLSGFIRHSLPTILSAEPTAGLVIVGESPHASLNKLGEEDEVLREIERSQKGEHIVFLGHVDNRDLTACYAIADVQVLPLVEVPGDVEGFGMIAVEAAASGTPTVAFDLGGVSDAISAENGYLIPAQDYTSLSNSVIDILRTQQPDRESCINHARNYSWPLFHARVRAALAELLPS